MFTCLSSLLEVKPEANLNCSNCHFQQGGHPSGCLKSSKKDRCRQRLACFTPITMFTCVCMHVKLASTTTHSWNRNPVMLQSGSALSTHEHAWDYMAMAIHLTWPTRNNTRLEHNTLSLSFNSGRIACRLLNSMFWSYPSWGHLLLLQTYI